MRNRTFITITLVMTVFFAGVSCCCLQQKAAASIEVPECHQHSSPQKEQHSKDCPCDYVLSLAAKQSIELVPVSSSDFYKLKDIALNYGKRGGFSGIRSYISRFDADILEFFDTSPPLFIQFSNLRL